MSRNKLVLIVVSIFVAIIATLLITGFFVLERKHKNEITRVIESKGAIVVHIAKINAEDSPFSNQNGKDNIIYKVTYAIDNLTHIAWYRGV
ncbi:hypothetical protein [Paenibacillus gorillae]|uniref:hypothetical protein n=1 Tax=Paenibacillus gorillae TaxID=1243662 RepID=UPI00069456E4|nr:hypothetical protein [Paenibacillus gorillae]